MIVLQNTIYVEIYDKGREESSVNMRLIQHHQKNTFFKFVEKKCEFSLLRFAEKSPTIVHRIESIYDPWVSAVSERGRVVSRCVPTWIASCEGRCNIINNDE